MKDYKRMTVGEIVADNFNNAGIFDKYGIDFCCHGPHCFPKPVKLPEPIWRR
jgi:regulator of cell morphogenesis and NO signaling